MADDDLPAMLHAELSATKQCPESDLTGSGAGTEVSGPALDVLRWGYSYMPNEISKTRSEYSAAGAEHAT